MTDENKQALESWKGILNACRHKQENEEDSVRLTLHSQDLIWLENILAALQPKPSVDVEALKKIALDGVMQGREHSRDLRSIAFEIISESLNILNSQGHLNQGWRDDGTAEDLRKIRDKSLNVFKHAKQNPYGEHVLTRQSIQDIAKSINNTARKLLRELPPKSEGE